MFSCVFPQEIEVFVSSGRMKTNTSHLAVPLHRRRSIPTVIPQTEISPPLAVLSTVPSCRQPPGQCVYYFPSDERTLVHVDIVSHSFRRHWIRPRARPSDVPLRSSVCLPFSSPFFDPPVVIDPPYAVRCGLTKTKGVPQWMPVKTANTNSGFGISSR
jgi:hypothetical protein